MTCRKSTRPRRRRPQWPAGWRRPPPRCPPAACCRTRSGAHAAAAPPAPARKTPRLSGWTRASRLRCRRCRRRPAAARCGFCRRRKTRCLPLACRLEALCRTTGCAQPWAVDSLLRCGETPDAMLPFERRDFVFVLQRNADVVQSFQQAVAPERIDLERKRQVVVIRDGALLQVDGELVPRRGLGAAEELVDLLLGQPHGQNAVLEAVVVEDVRKRRRNQHP